MCRCFVVSALFTIVGVATLILGLIMAFAVFDILIDDEVRELTMLRNGTEQFDRWVSSPDPTTLRFYFLQVTNPEAVANDRERPIVEEIGPFVYNMSINRQNIVIDTNGDTLSYTAGRTLVFDAAASAPLTQAQTITILNVPLQSAQQHFDMINQLTLFNQQWRLAFNIPVEGTSPLFHTVTVQNFLFDGITFCTNIQAAQFCDIIRGTIVNSRTLREVPTGIAFSYFPTGLNLNDGTFLITGGLDSDDVGSISRWNDLEYLGVWDGDDSSCNRIRGTDGTIFPPFNDRDSAMDVFYPDICRIFNLEYDGKTEVQDVDAYRYTLKSQVFADTSEDRLCHCINITKNLDGDNVCLPNGFEDLYNCFGSHLVLSLPHLLWADNDYANTVQGLSPNESYHESYADLVPRLGSTLATARRLQFNMLVRNNTDLTLHVDPGVMPIFWFEEVTQITEELVDATITGFLNWTFTLEVMQWCMIAIGGAITIVSFITCLCCR